MMNRKYFIALVVCFCLFLGNSTIRAQKVALKANVLNYATASLNLEPEVAVGRKSTLALGVTYNPWTFSDNMKWRHLRVQPEYRYWLCRPFGGHFLGLHASYTRFNVGNVSLPFDWFSVLKDSRVQGNEWAVGVGYGYHWILSSHWSMEAEVGVGYSHADFDRYECQKCGDRLDTRHTNRFLPTKLALSFIYVIR